MKSLASLIALCVLVCSIPSSSSAEEFEDLVARAQKFKEEKQYSKAIVELEWASKELQKLHQAKLQTFFPAEALGLKGGPFTSQTALGLVNIQRTYGTLDGKRLRIAIVGSSGDTAAAQGMGALAGLAQMAAMFDTTGQADIVRVNDRRATIHTKAGNLALNIALTSGTMVEIEDESGEISREELLEVAETLEYDELDQYLRIN